MSEDEQCEIHRWRRNGRGELSGRHLAFAGWKALLRALIGKLKEMGC
jgi:hypothetical protein